jgi:predicted dehydrogenase
MARSRLPNLTRPASKPPLPIVAAPELPYLPRDPASYRPGIALIGCGGITKWHLHAYRRAKYRVVALCDVIRSRAEQRRDEFYPRAFVTDSYAEVLARPNVEVVDITTHPPERPPLIEAALRAKKHVLSQKPFVLDLDEGERLAAIADEMGVRLAVNQNGRWAPHWSYLREAAGAGLLGTIDAVHCDVHWDHSWVKGTPFERVYHLILYDFAIHWFDFVSTLMQRGEEQNATVVSDSSLVPPRFDQSSLPRRVVASLCRSSSQSIAPPLLAQVGIEYESAQATLIFDAFTQFGRTDRSLIIGSQGTIRSDGMNSDTQRVELTTAAGIARPRLKGAWFPDGFHGTMGELLCAIEENREPTHSARNNLASLALCFAAVASAECGEPIVPGTVRTLSQIKF